MAARKPKRKSRKKRVVARKVNGIAGKPGLPMMNRRTAARGDTLKGAAREVRISRLPTATDELRARGLRYLLTMKSNVEPAELARKFDNVTGLTWQVEPLFRGMIKDRLGNYLLATVRRVSHRDLQVNPFDLGDELFAAAAGDIARIEPDLPHNVYDPGSDVMNPLRLRGATRGGDGDEDITREEKNIAWHLEQTGAIKAWDMPAKPGGAQRGAGIRVAHPDTGYTLHDSFPPPSLDRSSDYDFVSDDEDAHDPLGYRGNPGHGTKTASVIAGRGVRQADGQQVKGVAYAATLVPIRTIKSVVILWNGDVARAIKHAVDTGCHVISMSLGGLGTNAIEEAVNFAADRDVIVLAAAGNQVSFVVSPANYPRCIAVAACNIDRHPWKASAHGKAIAIAAPGQSIFVAKPQPPGEPQNGLLPGSGTSYAVAHVAGAAAMWLAHHGRDNLLAYYAGRRHMQSVFRELLTSTAKRPQGWDSSDWGPGILDIPALLDAPLPPSSAPHLRPGRTRAIARTADAAVIRTPVERLATLFDDTSPEQVKATLRAMVGSGNASPATDLDRYALEMLHLLGKDPMAREVFRENLQRSLPRGGGGLVRRTSVLRARNLLADRASNNLARALLL